MFKFWMVWCSEHGTPKKRHSTLGKARAEAERLAAKHPGFKFHLLEVIGTCQTAIADPAWTSDYQYEPDSEPNQATGIEL